MKRSRRQVEKDGANRLDGSWPRPDYTTCVGTAVHQDRKTPCSHLYWAARFSRILTTGTLQNYLYDISCIGIRSEKAIVQSIRQKCMSKYISEQTGNSVSVLHLPSRVKQYHILIPPETLHSCQRPLINGLHKEAGHRFYKHYTFRIVHNNSAY